MQQEIGKWLWLEWALATLIGYVVGSLLALLVAVPLAYAAPSGWLANAAGGAVIGGITGAAQWLVLRRSRVAYNSRSTGPWWVLAGLLGGLLGLALGAALGDLLAPALTSPPADRAAAANMIPLSTALATAVSGLLFGLMLSGAQWLALRFPARAGGWWLAANGLGWMLGLALGAVAAIPISVIGGMLTTGVAAGVITGLAFQRTLWPAINRTDR
jgi:hypothetical protein